MTRRTLEFAIAIVLASAQLAACSPPSPSAPDQGEVVGQSIPAEPQATRPSRSAVEAERREDRSAASARSPGPTQYTWVDERGKLQLAGRLEDIPERQRATATPIETPVARSSEIPDEGRAVRNVDVTIYTTSYCGYCRAAMAYFDKLGIDYVNHDVEQDVLARSEYLELTGGRRGVPVIVVGDSWIQGWSQPEFDRLLAAATQ